MSQSAKLFHHATDLETLHRRIRPSADQFQAQKERWNDLKDFLLDRLAVDTSCTMSSWLQGSYKFSTQIRPWNNDAEFDIDLGLYFGWSGEAEDGDHSPEGLKGFVQDALIDYMGEEENDATEVTDPKERCCRIRFAPDFHIDVPCYHLDAARDARSLATETKGWEESDPKAIYTWFKATADDATRKRMRRQIRYLKMWAALRFEETERPSSILLTVLTAEAFSEIDTNAALEDDDLLEKLAAIIAVRLNDEEGTVPNPINKVENINRLSSDATDSLIERLHDLASIGERARVAADIATAAEIWAEAFDQFFPMPEDTEEGTRALAGSQMLAMFRYTPDVLIRAESQTNNAIVYEGLNEIRPVPKNFNISFRIAHPERLPAGATIKWTVRNHGKEAENENDMGHVAGYGEAVERHTEYNGDHAMDLTVFLNGAPVGRRRVTVKVRGLAIAPRQLPSKRKFRSR